MDAPPMWKIVMNVTADAMEAIAGILACGLVVGRHGVGAQSTKTKLGAQMAMPAVMDLMDACCVFVDVQDQVLKQFGTDVLNQIRNLWLGGSVRFR